MHDGAAADITRGGPRNPGDRHTIPQAFLNWSW